MEKAIHMLFTGMISLFLLTTFPRYHCQQDNEYTICSRPYRSQYYGADHTTVNISYPFWGHVYPIFFLEEEQNRPAYCGGGDSFKLNNGGDDSIQIGSQNFGVMAIDTTTHTMRLVRRDLVSNFCSPEFNETYLSPTLFRYADSVFNISIYYTCSSFAQSSYSEHNFTCGHDKVIYVDDDIARPQTCARRVQVPLDVPRSLYGGEFDALKKALEIGFEVNYFVVHEEECTTCLKSGGVCGSNQAAQAEHQFTCYCPDGSNGLDCSVHKSNHLNAQRKVLIGIAGATVGLLICVTFLSFRCRSSTWNGKFWLTRKSNKDIEAFLKHQGALTLRRYKFSDVKKMTNSFKIKLGQGGFGIVYKGKLLTDNPVAVKILNSTKGNGEEFINEVASISRTSHVNVVTLLGFCLEGRKKALIYEFMPNGSLDKFIYNKGPETILSLSWDSLYQIAVGIAKGLEYLHKGCNTRILHFDIKPHNILLDENFCPKISDFGLAKLCPKKESIISMSDARGTMGYVAPEIWNRHFGGVSHKSDVYSYGMMLLEMVGGRKNINAEASQTSEIYFPHLVYKRLELGNDLRPEEVMTSKENEIAKKMTIVGLWCIQTFPNDRPTMSGVIDMLEGVINSLEMPPKPILSSPTRSVPQSSS